MSRILTAEAAFKAGFEESCEHLVPDPNDCPKCRLSEAEIRRLAVLLRSETTPAAGIDSAAA